MKEVQGNTGAQTGNGLKTDQTTDMADAPGAVGPVATNHFTEGASGKAGEMFAEVSASAGKQIFRNHHKNKADRIGKKNLAKAERKA
jgi:hypothetical protein